MLSFQKGFSPVLIIIVTALVLAAFAGGYYFSNLQKKPLAPSPSPISNQPQPSSTHSSNPEVPDNWKTFTYPEKNLSLKLPPLWTAEVQGPIDEPGYENRPVFILIRDDDPNFDPFTRGSLRVNFHNNPNKLTAREFAEQVHIPQIKEDIKKYNYEEANIEIFNFESSSITPIKVTKGDAVKLEGSMHVAQASSYPVYFIANGGTVLEISGNPRFGEPESSQAEKTGEEIISTIQLN